MASIEHTAYPRFKRSPSARELEALYTPTSDELSFARKAQPRFGLLLLLKAFQRLGYFPAVAVRKTSRPHTARIRDESQPAHGQGKA
ncbi:MAG: DUF4158 domain-containing protein [Rugosibacter sp.]|nr:MAG: DUF4158 domain-containing protein [Rugosibacter sp.]